MAVCAGGGKGEASQAGRLGPHRRYVLLCAIPGSPPKENGCAA